MLNWKTLQRQRCSAQFQ